MSTKFRLSAVAYPAERLQDLWSRKLNVYIGRKTDGLIWRVNKEEKYATSGVHCMTSLTIRFPVEFLSKGLFATLRQAPISLVMSVRLRGTIRLPVDGFLW